MRLRCAVQRWFLALPWWPGQLRRSGIDGCRSSAWLHHVATAQVLLVAPVRCQLIGAGGRFAARSSGLAFGLALAVRPAGLAEVSRVNGAPQARPAQRDAEHR